MTEFQVDIYETDSKEQTIEKFKSKIGEKVIKVKQRLKQDGTPFIYKAKPVFIVTFESKKDWA